LGAVCSKTARSTVRALDRSSDDWYAVDLDRQMWSLVPGHDSRAMPSSRSRGDFRASGIRINLHHRVGPQAPVFPRPTSVKGRPNRLRDPPHMAVASGARCDRRGKPGKSIDYLTGKYRSGGTSIHVVHGHDNFVDRIVVNPDVELIIAERCRPRQRQGKSEHIDRSITSPTHSRYSKGRMGGAGTADALLPYLY
jgi:hypothetical protein